MRGRLPREGHQAPRLTPLGGVIYTIRIHGGLSRRVYAFGETRGTIASDSPEFVEVGLAALQRQRADLDRYALRNPVFQHSFEPVKVIEGPTVVKRMAQAAEKAGVGPMAAVAGAIADLAAEEMIAAGARVALIEDGGEASLHSDQPVDIALQAGSAPLSKRLGFRVARFPSGVATSSGVYSHAFSFGDAEAVTVFAGDAALADAAATAACNLVSGADHDAAVRRGVDKALSIPGVEGVFILYKEATGTGGRLPEIIRIQETD